MSWEYLAGFFDGEGSIRVQMGHRATAVHIGIHQSDERGKIVLTEIKQFLCEEGIPSGLQFQRLTPNTNKPMYRLYVYNIEAAKKFVEGVMPYLRIKKLECQDIYRFVCIFPPYYAWLGARMKALGCEMCGAPRHVSRSRTCGSDACKSKLVWMVRRRQAPAGRYLPMRLAVGASK